MTTRDGLAGQRPPRVKGAVLVVDDERPVRELLEHHLQDAGFTVTTAPDAVVAGRLLVKSTESFDLLILDAHMPYMSGIELAAALIADTTRSLIPIVLITGHRDLATRADTLDVPCLLKPFTVDQLIRVVENSIANNRPLSTAGFRHDIKILREYEVTQQRSG